MFELDSSLVNKDVLKVVCLGRMADIWKKSPEFKDISYLEGSPMDADSWRRVNLGVIVADAAEDGILDEVRKSVAAAREHELCLFVMLLSAEPIELKTAVLSITADKIADEHEFCAFVHKSIKAIETITSCYEEVSPDFEDVKEILADSGQVGFGYGEGNGEKACETAAKAALEQLETMFGGISQAKGILLHVIGREDNLSMTEIFEVTKTVQNRTNADCNIIWGSSIDNSLDDGVRVILLTRS